MPFKVGTVEIVDGGFMLMDVMQRFSFRRGGKMAKICILLIACMFTFSSCTFLKNSTRKLFNDSESIMEKTLEEMVSAIQSQDEIAFAEMFSITVQGNTEEFLSKVNELFTFIEGEIKSFGFIPGISESSDYHYGKKRIVANASCWLETTEHKYYLSICECTIDTFDKNNVGVKSVYIIDADEWKEECAYIGGDAPGINIDRGN